MKTLEYRCPHTVEKKNGDKSRCNKFLCEISWDRILLVCRKCGTRFGLRQDNDGRWSMTELAPAPTLRLKPNKEANNGTT